MNRPKTAILVFYIIVEVVICSGSFFNDNYKRYPSRRLTRNIIKTMRTSSALNCTIWCSMTDGCFAVNVIGDHDITCELTTGLSNETEMEDDLSSELYVLDFDKCTEEPAFCLNGATWTSARCHCADRFQGDRCENCSERFQGESCQECAPRFQGDECQQCSERFQGMECQQCAQNYYGDNCEVSFTSMANAGCSAAIVGTPYDFSANFETCKEECAFRDDCGGLEIYGAKCYLKDTTCKDTRSISFVAGLFMKKVN